MFSQVSVCPQEGGVHPRADTPLVRQPPPPSGRYASYWNAFLFFFKIILLPQKRVECDGNAREELQFSMHSKTIKTLHAYINRFFYSVKL